MRDRRRVLLLAYHFDADEEIGGVRPRAYGAYLSGRGWDVLVVTAGDPANDTTTPSLTVRHVPPATRLASAKRRLDVERPQEAMATRDKRRAGAGHRPGGRARRLGREVAGLLPEKASWGIRAARRAGSLGRHWRADVVLSSAPTHVVNLTAWHVAGTLHVPWVAEFRDLWGRNPFRIGTRLRRLPDLALERLTLRRAAALVTVSEPLAETLRADHPRIPVHAIPTGVDAELVAPGDEPLDEHFCLLYAGRLYLGHRDLASVLRPLRVAIDRGLVAEAAARLHVLLLDPLPAETEALIDELGLGGVVELEYRVPRDEVIRRQRRAQLLLHLRWDAAREAGIITGKIYEYLAARRPILSTGRYRDVAVELLESTGAGQGATDDEQVILALGRAFDEWRATGRVAFRGHDDLLRRLDLRGTAAAMAEVLESAAAGSPDEVRVSGSQ